MQRILDRSTNADWDDLFENSAYVVPWAGVRLHNQGAADYLAISADAAVRAGTAQGSFHNMGRRISGSTSYGTTLRNRCTQVVAALEGRDAAGPAGRPGHAAPADDAGARGRPAAGLAAHVGQCDLWGLPVGACV